MEGINLPKEVQQGEVCAACGVVKFREAHGRPVLCVRCHNAQAAKFSREYNLPKAWFEEK